MKDTISRRSYCLIAVWAAAIVLFYFMYGSSGMSQLARYRSETEKAREAWIASPTTDLREPEPDETAVTGSRPVDVHAGIEMNRFGEFSLVESGWTADFDIWFRWTGDSLNPGETFEIANGEILHRERKQSVVRGTERYERYRVTARIAKSFDPSRFPFSDEGLVIMIEDTEHGAERLRYVADTALVDMNRLPMVWTGQLRNSFLLVKLHRYNSAFDMHQPGVGARMNSMLVFAMIAVPPGTRLYLRLMQALFASVAITFVVFFIKPIHVDPRFGLSIGAFFAAVGNNIYVASQLPQSDRITLAAMVNAVGLITIFLAIVQSAISLYMLDTLGRERLSRLFDMVSFAALLIGYIAANVMLPMAARS